MKKSKAAGIGFGILFLILVIVGGLLYYSYSQISVSLNDVSYHSIDWTEFSWSTLLSLGLNALTGNWLSAAFDLIDGVNLNLFFGISNNGLLPVYIPDLSYDLSVNGIRVGEGITPINETIFPGQEKEVKAFQNIKKSSFSPAISSIVSNSGEMQIHVKGTAHFNMLGLNIPIPFESTKTISVYDEIKNKILGSSNSQKQNTYITLNVPKNSVSEGSSVYISGRLNSDEGPIRNARIDIKDEDTGSGDDLIKSLRTDSNGEFGFTWIAKPRDPFDNIVEIYAVFEGSSSFKRDASQIHIVSVSAQKPSYAESFNEFSTQNTFKTTRISLNIPITSVDEGQLVPITGKLVDSSGIGVPNALVFIKDEDTGSGDDDLKSLRTKSNGTFGFSWNAKKMDPFDRTVEIYAVFEGSSNYGDSRSIQINVRVN